MNIRIKKRNKDGMVRLGSSGSFKEILFNEDVLQTRKHTVSVCFAKAHSSGIIDFELSELEKLLRAVAKRDNIIKDVKILRG